MTKTFCDICGEEITNWSEASEFKLKKRIYSFYEYWWERTTVHTECWRKLCDELRRKNKND